MSYKGRYNVSSNKIFHRYDFSFLPSINLILNIIGSNILDSFFTMLLYTIQILNMFGILQYLSF